MSSFIRRRIETAQLENSSTEEVNRFINEAPDEIYLATKVNFMPFKECDAKKEPCKRPPGKCDKKEEKKKEKCPDMPKKKKCVNWTSAYRFWKAKENILPTHSWQDIVDPFEKALKCEGCTKFPYDKSQADYEKVSKRKCQNKKNPKCQRKKRKTVPDSCTSDDCGKHCINHNSQLIIFELGKDCNKSSNKEKCPNRERKCPVVDNTVDERFKPKNPCCVEEKKGSHKKPKYKPKVYIPDQRDY